MFHKSVKAKRFPNEFIALISMRSSGDMYRSWAPHPSAAQRAGYAKNKKSRNPKGNPVLSVGTDKTLGHPDEEVLGRLANADVVVMRTDQLNTIVCYSDGAVLTFSTEST